MASQKNTKTVAVAAVTAAVTTLVLLRSGKLK